MRFFTRKGRRPAVAPAEPQDVPAERAEVGLFVTEDNPHARPGRTRTSRLAEERVLGAHAPTVACARPGTHPRTAPLSPGTTRTPHPVTCPRVRTAHRPGVELQVRAHLCLRA